MGKERGSWGSRLGFVLAAAGSAVGLGAVWKFPYMAGDNGGGAFLVLYLAAVLLIGLTMMLAELAVGRATQQDAVGAFLTLGGKGWSFFGYFSLLAAFIILSFYCVVGGWTIGYLGKALSGSLLAPPDVAGLTRQFAEFNSSPAAGLICFALFMSLTASIILGGVKQGIERASKVLMPLLFLLMLAMIIRSVTLPGAMTGIRFFLIPAFDKITYQALIDALGFACFSLSLGFGGMLTYGSYMRKDEHMVQSALWVVVLQTISVLMAGFMVLPAVFAFQMPPDSGPGLTFITLPVVFKAMSGGSFFAVLFFLLLLLAALTSSVSILEPLVAWLIDRHHVRRVPACLGIALASLVAGIPASLSFGLLKEWTVLGKTAFDLMNAVTLNFMLPVNVLAACLLMGWVVNRGFLRELYQRRLELRGELASNNNPPVLIVLINGCCRWVAPAVILLILISGLFF